jgi:hypothetical protein
MFDFAAHFSTIKVFRNGTPTDYTGPRKADGIISYMVKSVTLSILLFSKSLTFSWLNKAVAPGSV